MAKPCLQRLYFGVSSRLVELSRVCKTVNKGRGLAVDDKLDGAARVVAR